MRKAIRPALFIVAVALAFAIIVVMAREPKGDGNERVAWRGDYAAALGESARTHKPVLAYFTAKWCGPCQEMRRTTWSDERVAADLEKRFVPVKLDVDEQRNLAAGFQIESIPSYLVLDEKGRVIRRDGAYRSADEFLAWLHGK